MKIDVVLPAAGSSERINLPIAKQFQKVLGSHILAYTVDCFHRLSWVRHIVVVVSADQIEFARELMANYGFSRVIICPGSHTRHRSIFCGLKSLKSECSDSDVVIIHDAARPFVSEQVIRAVAEAAMTHGAAGVTRPLISTVIRGNNEDILVESLDRRFYRNSEMPQAFHYVVITSAYEKCSEDDFDHGTECLLLALNYSGCHASLVHGTDDLWKVTYQKDIYSMESVVKEKFTTVSILNNCCRDFLFLEAFRSTLNQRQLKIAKNTDAPANTFVVMWDSRQNVQDTANKICNLYKQDMPSSAVKLDLMLVIVFIHNSHLQMSSDKNINAETHQQHSRSEDVNVSETHQEHSRSEDVNVSETDFYSDVFHSNSQSNYNNAALGCISVANHSSESNFIMNDFSSQSSQQFCSEKLTVLHTDNTPPVISHHHHDPSNTCNFVSNVSESPRCDFFASVSLSSQKKYFEQHHITCPASSDLQDHARNLFEQRRKSCLSWYKSIISSMKEEVQKEIAGKFVLVVGVSCGIQSAIGEKLAELIWQRSLYADGQIVMFDDV